MNACTPNLPYNITSRSSGSFSQWWTSLDFCQKRYQN